MVYHDHYYEKYNLELKYGKTVRCLDLAIFDWVVHQTVHVFILYSGQKRYAT